MATSITAATLTVTLTEAISLNEQDKGSTNSFTIASVTEVSQRIVNVPTSEVTLLAFQATTPGAATFNEADVRYIRLTNKDDTNFVQITIKDESNDEVAFKLENGKSFIYTVSDEGTVATMLASASAVAVPATFVDLANITALADTAACDVEYFVAGV
tara:strand:+ start:68 stop:541 length:474 start_codon:yes stop_codon:yes gene_type:complete